MSRIKQCWRVRGEEGCTREPERESVLLAWVLGASSLLSLPWIFLPPAPPLPPSSSFSSGLKSESEVTLVHAGLGAGISGVFLVWAKAQAVESTLFLI